MARSPFFATLVPIGQRLAGVRSSQRAHSCMESGTTRTPPTLGGKHSINSVTARKHLPVRRDPISAGRLCASVRTRSATIATSSLLPSSPCELESYVQVSLVSLQLRLEARLLYTLCIFVAARLRRVSVCFSSSSYGVAVDLQQR